MEKTVKKPTIRIRNMIKKFNKYVRKIATDHKIVVE